METLTGVVGWVTANYGELGQAALLIIGGFAVLARFTANEADDKFTQTALNWINRLGMNGGMAKNEELDEE